MSEWFEVNKHDIDYDFEDKTVDIIVNVNDNGNVYAELPFDMVKEMYLKIIGYNKELINDNKTK